MHLLATGFAQFVFEFSPMTILDKYIEEAKDEKGFVRIERLIPYFGGKKSSGNMKEVMEYIRKNKIPFIIIDFGNNFEKPINLGENSKTNCG